jgi:type IV pilus assembly protein PilA
MSTVPRTVTERERQETRMLIQDRLTKIRNKRGFTLVELMIVVAIIGVLAALAIYGVRKYLANAKTAEARMSLGRIAKDATVAYEKEKVDDGIIGLGSVAEIAHSLCPDSSFVPATLAEIANRKYQSSPVDWNDAGWACLKFTMNDPQYFRYQYDVTQAAATAAVGDQFVVTAQGDLDGDGVPSAFSLGGQIQEESNEEVLTLAATITESNAEE